MMNIFLIQLATLTIWVAALSDSQQAHQVPRDLLKQPGDSVQLNCSHNITSYDTILWYQQLEGDPALTLFGYVRFDSPTIEMTGKNFSVTGDGRNDAFLHLNKLKPADSAVYFCAASYAQCISLPLPSTKTYTLKAFQFTNNMAASHITSFSVLLWIMDSAMTTGVSQTPPDMFKNREVSAEFQCSHNISGYNVILWYQQPQAGGMTLLGYVYRITKVKEKPFEQNIELNGSSGENEKSFITIKNLSSDDSALYYCAASVHSAIHPVLSSQKLISISHDS
ncbi:uncharacterized protein LOC143138949 [Alosa pseudoharengus]|uniref:uncharacterized protein LOC143138949 n=1 Tax=Alosa pseudoharengus TaxID=34774 RepID=UPI003F8B4A4F